MSNFSFYSHLSVKRPASTHISPLYVMHSHKWETVCDSVCEIQRWSNFIYSDFKNYFYVIFQMSVFKYKNKQMMYTIPIVSVAKY